MTSPLRRRMSAFPLCTETLSNDVLKATPKPILTKDTVELNRFLAHVPARLHSKRPRLESSRTWYILPEPRSQPAFSPRRGPPSLLGGRSSVRLCSRMHAPPPPPTGCL